MNRFCFHTSTQGLLCLHFKHRLYPHIYWIHGHLGETDSNSDCASCCSLQCQAMVGFWDKGTLLSQDTFMFIARGFTVPCCSEKTHWYVLTFVPCTSLHQTIVAQLGEKLSLLTEPVNTHRCSYFVPQNNLKISGRSINMHSQA